MKSSYKAITTPTMPKLSKSTSLFAKKRKPAETSMTFKKIGLI
jgi:hypothetical protein